MTEGAHKYRPDTELDTFMQYSGSSYNVLARAKLYEKAVPYIDIRHEATRALELKGDETILDIGCGDGSYVISLVEDYGHQGNVIGVNDSVNTYFHGQERAQGYPNISFGEMDAQYLDFPDNSIDVISAQFLLYHVDDPLMALREMKRVLKPNGKALVATRGNFNHIRMWQAGRLLERQLPSPFVSDNREINPTPKAPEVYYTHFDLEGSRQTLDEYFEVVPGLSMKQESIIRLYSEDWEIYHDALFTLKDSFKPKPRASHMHAAIEDVFKPIFDNEIEHYGYFTEYVQQGFFICNNTK